MEVEVVVVVVSASRYFPVLGVISAYSLDFSDGSVVDGMIVVKISMLSVVSCGLISISFFVCSTDARVDNLDRG